MKYKQIRAILTPMTTAYLIEIFCILDEFCKYFTPELKKHLVDTPCKQHRNHPCRLSDSEVMTILVLFHTKHFRDLKSFYLGYVCQHMKNEFPHTVSYNRFVERQAQQVGLYDEKRGCVDVDIPSLVFR